MGTIEPVLPCHVVFQFPEFHITGSAHFCDIDPQDGFNDFTLYSFRERPSEC